MQNSESWDQSGLKFLSGYEALERERKLIWIVALREPAAHANGITYLLTFLYLRKNVIKSKCCLLRYVKKRWNDESNKYCLVEFTYIFIRKLN